MLCEAKPWLQVHKTMPTELNINWDGGSENRNKVLYACMEHLAGKYMTELGFTSVLVTRLPVGHTHNDNDQEFGIIDGYFHRKEGEVHATSWPDYVKGATNSLTKRQWKSTAHLPIDDKGTPEFILLGAVFDMDSWITPHLNKDFSRYASTKDWMGGEYILDNGRAKGFDEANLPKREKVRSAKSYIMQFFKAGGGIWHRCAPRMVTPDKWWPANADTINPVGKDDNGKELYGYSVLIEEPTVEGPGLSAPYLLEAPEYYDKQKKALSGLQGIEEWRWITAEGTEANMRYMDARPKSEGDTVTSDMFVLPEWNFEMIRQARFPGDSIVERPVPPPKFDVTQMLPMRYDPVCGTSQALKELVQYNKDFETATTILGTKREVANYKTKEWVMFTDVELVLPEEVKDIKFKWLPLTLGKVSVVNTEHNTLTMDVYHADSYGDKFYVWKVRNKVLSVVVPVPNCVLSTWCGKKVSVTNQDKLTKTTLDALFVLVIARYEEFKNKQAATGTWLSDAGISGQPYDQVGKVVRQIFFLNKEKTWFNGKVVEYKEKAVTWSVTWEDEESSMLTLSQLISALKDGMAHQAGTSTSNEAEINTPPKGPKTNPFISLGDDTTDTEDEDNGDEDTCSDSNDGSDNEILFKRSRKRAKVECFDDGSESDSDYNSDNDNLTFRTNNIRKRG